MRNKSQDMNIFIKKQLKIKYKNYNFKENSWTIAFLLGWILMHALLVNY